MSQQDHWQSHNLTRRLVRRLWLERLFWLLLVGALVALYLGALPGGRRVTLIAADGEPIAVVPKRGDAQRLLDEVKSMSGLPADRIAFAQKVTFHQVPASRNPVQSDRDALQALSSKLDPVVEAAAITAGGELVLALPDQQQAVKTLSLLLQEFSPPGPSATAYFRENIKIDTRAVPPDMLYPSAEKALEKIVEASAPKSEYTVKSGDSAWKIANDHDVPLSRLAAQNPDIDTARLQVGQKVKIPGDLPPLTVIARREITQSVGSGGSGRTRKVRITYENGVEVKRDVIGLSAPPPSPRTPSRPPTRGATDPWRWRDEIPE
ncbi:MAG TPA: LysM peptidoglycan-binding domain-containing protein [Armatimonadota bacterium]|nr:LysM peptidoglycan-binding domain-containing protein [Armatimonadota bacterium]